MVTILRDATMTTALLVTALETVAPSDPDLVRYAVTQGGLLAVVLILLWSMHRDSSRKDERLEVMTDLVAQSTAATARATEVLERLARSVENLERRHR
jgi:hypothetical protein